MEHVFFNIDLVNTPTSLTFISEHPTDFYCYSADYREDGDLLLGCGDGLRLLRREDMQMIRYNTNARGVTSAIEHHRNVFVLHKDGNTVIVEMCLPGVTQKNKLFELQRTDNTASFLAVSDKYVVAINPDNNQLVLYNFLTKQTTTLTLELAPWDVYFLLDGDLLVLSRSQYKSLTRYRIENNQLTKVWTCEDLTDGHSVCTDSDGLIYVSTRNKRKILYVLSTTGMCTRVYPVSILLLPLSCANLILVQYSCLIVILLTDACSLSF